MTQTRVPPPPLCRGLLTNKYCFSSKSNIDMVVVACSYPLMTCICTGLFCPDLSDQVPSTNRLLRSDLCVSDLCTKNCSATCLLAERHLIQRKNTQTDWVCFFLSYFVLVLQRCIEMSARSVVAWCSTVGLANFSTLGIHAVVLIHTNPINTKLACLCKLTLT